MIPSRFNDLARRRLISLQVADVMTPDPVTVGPDVHLSEAWQMMQDKGINHVPVVSGGKLRGLLSERHIRDAMPSVLLMSDVDSRHKALGLTRVSQVWIENPTSVSPETPLVDAIDIMRHYKAGSLPVTRDGDVVGILTSGDLISLLEALVRHDAIAG